MFLRMFLMDWSLEIGRTLFRYRGIPKNVAKLFFAIADFPELITFSFLNIFQKFQKEALEEIRGHITCLGDFSIFSIFGLKNLKKWNHAAWFHFLNRKPPKMAKIEKSPMIVRCPRVLSNASFWNFWKMLRNEKNEDFWKSTLAKKSFAAFLGIPLYRNNVRTISSDQSIKNILRNIVIH